MLHLLVFLLNLFVFMIVLPATLKSHPLDGASADHAPSLSGLGKIDFPTSGSPEAQPWFLSGVLLLHNFQYDDAKEAFQKAQALDPDFAMAYWGEAMTENHPLWVEQNLEEARTILNRLSLTPDEPLARAPTKREQAYLRAIEVLFGDGDKLSRDLAYADVMHQLTEDFPHDHEAAAFYALALLGTAQGERDFRTYMKAAAIAEEIFQKNPQHPGAVHYLIHSYDDPTHAPLGLRAARVYASLAPAASHAQHMPSHIFMALGMWDEVVQANETAWAASEARIQRKGLTINARPYHTLYWLEYGYLQQGQFEKAKKLVELVREDGRNTQSRYARGYLASMRSTYIIETQQWEVNHLNEDRSGLRMTAAASDLFALGMSAVNLNNSAVAQTVLEQFHKRFDSPNSQSSTTGQDAVRIMAKQLEGLLLWKEGKTKESLKVLRETTRMEDALPYEYGPPIPVKPTHELLGEILVELGEHEEAKKEFALALARTPQRALSLAGLSRLSP